MTNSLPNRMVTNISRGDFKNVDNADEVRVPILLRRSLSSDKENRAVSDPEKNAEQPKRMMNRTRSESIDEL